MVARVVRVPWVGGMRDEMVGAGRGGCVVGGEGVGWLGGGGLLLVRVFVGRRDMDRVGAGAEVAYQGYVEVDCPVSQEPEHESALGGEHARVFASFLGFYFRGRQSGAVMAWRGARGTRGVRGRVESGGLFEDERLAWGCGFVGVRGMAGEGRVGQR